MSPDERIASEVICSGSIPRTVSPSLCLGQLSLLFNWHRGKTAGTSDAEVIKPSGCYMYHPF
jgi:hypothetical protein